jgi:hypothetical protein
MGRPDTLGADLYHTRRFPIVRIPKTANPTSPEISDGFDPPYCAIIRPMVDFSKITRKVCHGIYLQDNSTARTVDLANRIEHELDEWVDSIPQSIRPQTRSPTQPETLKSAKEAKWMKRQRLVLLIRRCTLM